MFGGVEAVVSLIIDGKDQASGAFEAVSGKIGNLGGALGGLAVGGLAVAGGALVAAGAKAFQFSEDVDAAMREVEATTGLSGAALDDFKTQAEDVFLNNWGESIGDVATAMAQVNQVTGLTGDGLEGLTQNALIMRDVFQKDVGESVDAAQVLMDEFGISSDEAFDLMTSGIQGGLDRNGDFIDTIREYGNLFGDAGFSADQFYSLLETGAEGGVLGTDKVADAVKEMQIRLNEGGDDVSAAFSAIGMDFDEIQGFVSSGDESWADYFDNITAGLNGIEDPTARAAAQVAIFGTQAEDLGVSFTEGLSTASSSLEDMTGATMAAGDAVSGGLANAWSSFTRETLVALEPLGALIGQALEAALPYLESFGEWLSVNLPVAIAALTAAFEEYWPIIQSAVETAWIYINTNILQPLLTWFNGDAQEAIGSLRAIWEEVWPVVQSTLEAVWNFIYPTILQPLGEWLGETIPVVLEALRAAWVDVVWPAIQTAVDSAWATIKGHLEAAQVFFNETLPNALATLQGIFETAWSAIQTAIDTAWAVIQPIFEAVQNFATWLSTHVFSFSFSWPELPSWMQSDSPMRLHTASADFAKFLDGTKFTYQFEAPPESALALPSLAQAAPGGSRSSVVNNEYHININNSAAARIMLAYFEQQAGI